MSSDEDDFEEYIENVKNSARKSFARISANLEARESETIRQLNAIRKQCRKNKALKRICARNLHISYDNETELLDIINCYGTIDLERLNLHGSLSSEDSNISNSVDNISLLIPTQGHLLNEMQIRRETTVSESTCAVGSIRSRSEMSSGVKIRDMSTSDNSTQCLDPATRYECVDNGIDDSNKCYSSSVIAQSTEDRTIRNSVLKKGPTDDWLESIKTETDAEPLGKDTMEHINISGS